MKKLFGMSVAIIFSSLQLVIAQPEILPENNQSTDESSIEFGRVTMLEFKEADSAGLNTLQIRNGIYSYAQQMNKILTGSKIDNRAISSVMQEDAVFYGQAIVAIYHGKQLQEVIQDYVYKITAVFFEHLLDVSVQSQIVCLTSSNLEAMSSLLSNRGEGSNEKVSALKAR